MKIIHCILILICTGSCLNFQITDEECSSQMTETIPIGLEYNTTVISVGTFETWFSLISNANKSIEIASFYWSLFGTDVMPKPDNSSIKGQRIFDALSDAAKIRKVKIRIAVNLGSDTNSTDLTLLSKFAEIRQLNFTKLMGAGVLHTKFIVIDSQHFYVGSANMDWRSLTHVKELGISMFNCSVLANDLQKIFQVYWYLGKETAIIPKQWPKEYETKYNIITPLSLSINNQSYEIALSSAPKLFNPKGRTNDIDSIIYIIRNAKKYIYISVMDYIPALIYIFPNKFWPVIDDELKRAAIERKVSVKLLISEWQHSRMTMDLYLKSLEAFNNKSILGGDIQVKRFIVPATPSQQKIPFARVNHNKYMVTDSHGFIGTSNWSGDYFSTTAGVGVFIKPNNNTNGLSIRDHLESIFKRDWNSSYSHCL